MTGAIMPDPKALSAAAMAVARTTHAELPALLRAVKAAHVSKDADAIAAATTAMVITSRRQSAATTLAHMLDSHDGAAERLTALRDIEAGRPVREGVLEDLSGAMMIHGTWRAKPRLTDHGAAVLALYRELTTTEDR
jgi:hypothetical protein